MRRFKRGCSLGRQVSVFYFYFFIWIGNFLPPTASKMHTGKINRKTTAPQNMRRLAIISACLSAVVLVSAIIGSGSHDDAKPLAGKLHEREIDPLVPPISVEQSANRFSHDPQAESHAHGETMCASGCAASRHPTMRLTPNAFDALLTEYQHSAPTAENEALEKILFYSRQSREHWQRQRFACRNPLWQKVLDEELKKTHVLISLRVVDESGAIRSALTDVRVPLDRRHVFEMESDRLQPLVTSGTVKRVGLDHLWTRL